MCASNTHIQSHIDVHAKLQVFYSSLPGKGVDDLALHPSLSPLIFFFFIPPHPPPLNLLFLLFFFALLIRQIGVPGVKEPLVKKNPPPSSLPPPPPHPPLLLLSASHPPTHTLFCLHPSVHAKWTREPWDDFFIFHPYLSLSLSLSLWSRV